MIKPIIEVAGVKKIFKMGIHEIPALNGVDLKVAKGEFMGIMGPSGSGKTTLLDIIGALDRPTYGKVFVEGVDISKLDDDELAELRTQKIGFLFQFFNLIPRMTALSNVELPMSFAGVPQKQRRERASKLLEIVGLGNRLDHKPTELSGGEQQRVSMARALANNPLVILCDEPTGNLDTKTGKNIISFLRKMNKEQEQTFIIVTHDPMVAESVDRIAYLKDGIIIKDETLR